MDRRWTIQDSADLYHIPQWGAPYFKVNDAGNIACTGGGEGKPEVDLRRIVDHLVRRGIHTPILLRINDLLGARVEALANAFNTARQECGYQGIYTPAMPIKVNQQRHVVQELLARGAPWGLSLEAGSKPELLAAIALVDDDRPLIICNGYKDREYFETALLAQRLGRHPMLVLDRFEELDLALAVADDLGVKPSLGARVKLSSRGAGKWLESSGDKSKFGLTATELIAAVDRLRERGHLDALKMLHFHIGSQITSIRSVKEAVREAGRLYCALRAEGATSLDTIDVGGGLAVDYDGSKTNFHSSKNYSVQEYASDVVYGFLDVTDEAEQPHPNIITESGRALCAHHAILIFDVLGMSTVGPEQLPPRPTEDDHIVLHNMWDAYESVSKKNYQESYNDAALAKDECATLFAHGVVDLRTRASVEALFWGTLKKIQKTVRQLDYVPDDLEDLDKDLADTYFCNFSVFQSLPDSWAVNQLFPIAPLHRHAEEPTRDAILADITCDSDGKVDEFIDLRDVKDTLRLHQLNNEPYYLGVFLVGAYQETLGDLHNLFGDTNAVHVTIEEDGYTLDHVVQGDSVEEVLGYVEYDRADLLNRVRRATEAAVRRKQMTFEESAVLMASYERGLQGYTYLVRRD
jgi:arginine decarboxylase